MVRSRSLALPLTALAAGLSFVAKPGAPPRLPTTELAVALAAAPTEAWAKGGAWGPLEGKASSPSARSLLNRGGLWVSCYYSFNRF